MNILKNKLVLVLIAILVIGGIAYAYVSNETPASSDDLTVSSSDNNTVGADILSSLIEINSLNLDPAIFAEINTLQLKDFSQDLPDNIPVGKENPFAAITFGRSTTTPVLPGGPQKFATTTGIIKTISTVRPVPSSN